MIEMLLRKLSTQHYVFYMERRTYKNNKVYKSYVINIDRIKKEYNNKCDLLYGLKEMIQLAKVDDKTRKKIVADYVDNQSYSKTARKYNISVESVRRFVKADQEFMNKSEEKKKQNSMDTISYMNTQHERKKKILDKILDAIEKKSNDIDMFTNIKDLATAYGIIVDKELKVLELSKNNQEEKVSKIVIVNSLPKDEEDEQHN